MRHALALARWVSPGGRPVTAGRVLRRADVAAAGALLSVPVPARVRTAADVGQLHRPWCLAVAMGLIRVGEGRASSGPALELWPLSDAESLAGWLAGLRAVCAAESYPQDEDSVRLLARSLLMALDDAASPGRALWPAVRKAVDEVCEVHDKSHWEPLRAADRYRELESDDPTAGLVTLLAGFGAAAAGPGGPTITPLGRWAAQRICADLPALASPRLTAARADHRVRPVRRRRATVACRLGVAGRTRPRPRSAGHPHCRAADVAAAHRSASRHQDAGGRSTRQAGLRSGAARRLHAALPDRRGRALGREKRNQLSGCVHIVRASHDSGGVHRDVFNLFGNRADEINTRHRQQLADLLQPDFGLTFRHCAGARRHALLRHLVGDAETRKERGGQIHPAGPLDIVTDFARSSACLKAST